MKLLLILSLLFSTSNAFANLRAFEDQFKIIRDNTGKVLYVKAADLKNFTNAQLIYSKVKEFIQSNQESFQNSFQSNLSESTLSELSTIEVNGKAVSKYIEDSQKMASQHNLDEQFEKKEFKQFEAQVVSHLEKLLKLVDPSVLSAPSDKRYFLKKQLLEKFKLFIVNLALKTFEQIPYFRIAVSIANRIEDYIHHLRLTRQESLKYFLLHHDAKSLNITNKEADLILSSVYESQLSLSIPDLLQRKNFEQNFDKIGFQMISNSVRSANSTLNKNKSSLGKLLKRMNYSFQEVEINGSKQIINLLNKKHRFSKDQSIAFYQDNQMRVTKERIALSVAKFFLNYLPLPSNILNQVKSVINSYYLPQTITEGALIGYFYAMDDIQTAKLITKQGVNPMDWILIQN